MHLNPIEDHFQDPKTIQEPLKSRVALEPVFEILLGCLLDYFWAPFWGPFWDQIGPRRGQDEPKRAIKSFKDQKSYIFKKWFSHRTVGIFSLLRPPKRASRGPRRLPRGTQGAPKPQKKGIQKWTPKLTIFGPILGPFWDPFLDHFFLRLWGSLGASWEPSWAS